MNNTLCPKCRTGLPQYDLNGLCYNCWEYQNFIIVAMPVDTIPDKLLNINYISDKAFYDTKSYRGWLKDNGIEILRLRIPK